MESNNRMHLPLADTPLSVLIENDQLVIRVGIDTLAWAFENAEDNNPFDEELMDFKRDWKVVDSKEFAKDIKCAMLYEAEDGSNPLSRFLDKACEDAANDGSMALEEDGRTEKERN